MDLAALYTDAQQRVIDLVCPLSAPTLASRVPGAPKWTVEQLVAHLAGVAADLVDGNVEGVATEPWTARHIAEREGQPLSVVLSAWRDRTAAVLSMLATPGRIDACAFDILTHEHDLRGALGLGGASDDGAVAGVTARVTGRVDHLVAAANLPALRLVNDTDAWVCGSREVGVTGNAPTMEWFRALFGRRSAPQILTYTWDGDPSPYFEMLNLFGPLPKSDVAEAGAPVPVLRDDHVS